eukprot:5009821-Heterocapsa_arctica.AAC.1
MADMAWHRRAVQWEGRKGCMEGVAAGGAPARGLEAVGRVQLLSLLLRQRRRERGERAQAVRSAVLQMSHKARSGSEVRHAGVACRGASVQACCVADAVRVMPVLGPCSCRGQGCAAVVAQEARRCGSHCRSRGDGEPAGDAH